jgi:predicted nucleotidyltransferase
VKHHVSPRLLSPEARQYGERSSVKIRTTLLELARDFVEGARTLRGVNRIALLGSVVTNKPRPKDIDLLVSISESVDIEALARLARRLKGTAQARLNSGADLFLADLEGHYLGRICRYRECYRRVLCRARNCGVRPHLMDDFDVVELGAAVIALPPLELHPIIVARRTIPDDVERVLLAPLRADSGAG